MPSATLPPPPAGSDHQTIGRESEAERIAQQIAEPGRRLAVLHGSSGSGKTEFIRHWLLPALVQRGRRVYLGSCNPGLPATVEGPDGESPLRDALKEGSIVVLDNFDRFLSIPDAASRKPAIEMLGQLENGGLPGTLAVTVREPMLAQLLAYREAAPSLLDRLIEIKPIPFHEALERLNDRRGQTGLHYAPEAIAQLGIEAGSQPSLDVLALVRAVDLGFRHFKQGAPSGAAASMVAVPDVRVIGGLKGALSEFRAARIAEAEAKFGAEGKQVCEAILRETVAARKSAQPADFSDLPQRLDVPESLCGQVASWLTEVNLLKETGGGKLELALDPLADLIREEEEGSETELRHARKILSGAVRSQEQFNVPLPWSRLEPVHELRTRLRVTDAEAALMARSCLAHRTSEDPGDLAYWLRRIRRPDLRVSVLMEALFSPLSQVRVRAAQLLADHDDDAVRSQIYRMALQDPAEEVRSQAVASLGKMNTAEIWPLLAREARDPSSSERLNAIAALEIRKDAECAKLLGQLVADRTSLPPVRATAIATLGRIRTPESVDALTAISLQDPDGEDRRLAAKALAQLGDKDLVRKAIQSLRAPGSPRAGGIVSRFRAAKGPRFLLSLLAAAGNVVFHGLGLIALGRYGLGAAFLAAECAAIALLGVFGWVAFALLLGNWAASHLAAAYAAFSSGGQRGWIASQLHWPGGAFFFTGIPIVFFVHGTAHTMTGDWKRGLVLCVLQAVGISCMTWIKHYFGTYGVSVPTFSSRATELLSEAYYLFGAALWTGTLLWDVFPVIYRKLLFARQLRGEAIRMSAYEQLLGNQLAAESVVESALGPDREEATWATRLIGSLAHAMPFRFLAGVFEENRSAAPRFLVRALRKFRGDDAMETLSQLWTRYPDPRLRHAIVDVLAGSPTESSLDRLRGFSSDLDLYGKTRYYWASWMFRLRLWPKTVILIVVLAIPVAALAMYEMRAYVGNPVRQLHNLIASEDIAARDPALVASTARYLAERFPVNSIDQLVHAFDVRKNAQPVLQEGLADSLRIVACKGHGEDAAEPKAINALVAAIDSKRMHVAPAMASMARSRGGCSLSDASRERLAAAAKSLLLRASSPAGAKRLALDTLEASGAASVPEILQAFVLRENSPRSAGSSLVSPFHNAEFLRWREELPLRTRALEILGRSGSADAKITLREISKSAPELRQAAALQLDRSENEVVRSVQAEFDLGNFEAVRDKGDRLLKVSEEGRKLDRAAHYRVLCLMGEASASLAALAGDSDTARRDQLEGEAIFYLTGALQAGGADDSAAGRQLLVRVHDARARRLFSERKLSEKKLDQALVEANKAVEAGPKSVEARSTRGSVLLELGRRQEAFSDFATVTRLDPDLGWAYYVQSWIKAEERNFGVSMGLALMAIEKGYQESGPYAVLRRCYTDQNRAKEAIAEFQQLRARFPKVQWPIRHLAALYQDWAGDFEQAYRMLSKAEAEWKDGITGEDAKMFHASLLEVRLSTGRYREVIQGGPDVLKELEPEDHRLRIPLNLLIYAAHVLDGDRTGALRQLGEFEKALDAAPADFRPTWRYSGTIASIERKGVPPGAGAPMVELVKAADAMRTGVALPRSLIARNRAALQSQ